MGSIWLRRTFVLAVGLALLAGCAGKSAEEVEAERAKANAEWNAQVTGAERSRQAEENKLVQEEMAAHQQREQADDEREDENRLARQNAERDRLTSLVTAKFTDPQATRLADLRWNASNTAVCGTVSGQVAGGRWSDAVAFVASGDQATIDSGEAEDHARFVEAARGRGCTP